MLVRSGLPDGLFSNQKYKFGKILEGFIMEHAGIFYAHSEHFTVIWYILWPFGNVVLIWYIFPRFGILCQEKSGNPGSDAIGAVCCTKVSFVWPNVGCYLHFQFDRLG
jgi:hypothetical protein